VREKSNSVTELDDVYMTVFELADGKDCAIIWSAALDSNRTKSENVSKNVSLTVGDTEVVICDMLGNEVTAASSTGTYNLKVTGEPVYIIGDFTNTTIAAADSGSMIDDFYYNEVSDTIVINADGTTVTAALKQEAEVKQELELTVSADKVASTIDVDDALPAGNYTLEVVADGTTYTKTVAIPERKVEGGQTSTTSTFEPGMIALYTASTRSVKVMGKLTGRSENEPILVMVAKAPAEGEEIAEADIAYAKVFDGSTEDFELTFTLPEGAYGDYVVRAGAMNATNAMQNGLANPDEAVVCTFTASVENNTFSASATFANHSAEEARLATMIIAQYGIDNSLEAANFEEFTVTKTGGVTDVKTVSQKLDPDTIMCKAFVWNSKDGLLPLVGTITLPVTK